ncbi:MAG: nucleotidyltransferase family protein [Candidatus Omnitrophica bacterium]|nr:nucleotidyltransferase family protein [Candidatus Omnitrophota bacterium]
MQNTYLKAGYNLLLREEIKELFNLFNQTEIFVILIKGISLIETVYPDLSLREIADIDLFVKEIERARIQEILYARGYSLYNIRPDFFIKPTPPPIFVDLHSDPFFCDASEIFRNTQQINIENVKVRILTFTYMLIYSIYHLGIRHCHLREDWLRDINYIVRNRRIDWELFIRKVKEFNLATAAYLILRKVEESFVCGVPHFVFKNLKPKNYFKLRFFEKILYRKNPVYCIDYLLPLIFKPSLLFKYLKEEKEKNPSYLSFVKRISFLFFMQIKALLSLIIKEA